MTATYTDALRLTKQGDNDNPNTWGDVLNEQVIQLIQEAIVGVATIDVTGSSDVDISTTVVNGGTDDARHAVLELTGTISTDISLIVPSVNKGYYIRTDHTGGLVTVIPSGGSTGVALNTGDKKILYVTGTSIYTMVETGIYTTDEDTSPGTLEDKLDTGPSLVTEVLNPASDESIQLSLEDNMHLSSLGNQAGQGFKPSSAAPQTFVTFLPQAHASLTGKFMNFTSETTKTLSSTWVVGSGNGGLDTGTVAPSTTYYIWVINDPVNNITDGLISMSPTSPVMPTGYTEKRRVGYVKTNTSSQMDEWCVFWNEFGPTSSPTAFLIASVTSSNTVSEVFWVLGGAPATEGARVTLTSDGAVEADNDVTAFA